MAKYADNEIDAVKQNVSLLRLAEAQGHELRKEGRDYVMCCPFHDEQTASMKITPSNNLFHCFGCDVGGSVIDWVMKTQGVSFRHAVEILRTDSSLAAEPLTTKTTTVRKLASPLSEDADQQTALQQVISYYHDTLKQSPDALAYLKVRGLDDVDLIDHFKLGFANRSLGLHLPQKNRKAGAVLRSLLQEVGIYRDSGHEHFNGSLVIPVINDQKIREVYGRKITRETKLRKGTPVHLYLPGAHDGVFNLDGIGSVASSSMPHATLEHPCSSEVILCESLIDALTFWRWGFKHVTTSYGTSGFTNELLACLIERGVKRVLIAYDRDESGNASADKVAKKLNQNNIDAYRILFPKGVDANEYAVQGCTSVAGAGAIAIDGSAIKRLAYVIRKAEPIGEIVHQIDSPLAAKEAEQVLDVQASPMPIAPANEIPIEITDTQITLALGDRRYRVKGFNADLITDSLKVNLMVVKGDGGDVQGAMHMDKLDLYVSKQRQVFINQASVELGVEPDVIKRDLGNVLLQLEALQQSNGVDELENSDVISDDDRTAALELLCDGSLLSRILIDFNNAGVVGEESNKLVGYLACVSRLLAKPLAVMVQSSSAAGKSSLMDAILNLMPENERMQYSAMTGQSLFYMGETNLKHKILAISEEEGAQNASYALKLLQSEGEVTIASTGKDESTGDLITKEYRVEGPVMLFMTTTAIDIDEELLNRCLVLSVNESRAQTRAIHEAQRKSRTLEGLQSKLQKSQLTQIHRHAQQLLRRLIVINPYADQLTFLDDKTRTRRDHEKYLTLIDSIALLHQYQRSVKTVEHNGEAVEYIEVTLGDIEVANKLAHEILGRTLDELPPQTRKLLSKVQVIVSDQCKGQGIEQRDYRFSRKDIREETGWGNTQLKVHCRRLEEMEYLLTHRGGRGQSFEYELLYPMESNQRDKQVMGLIETDKLKQHEAALEGPCSCGTCASCTSYDAKKAGQIKHKSVLSRPQVGGVSESVNGVKLNGSNGLGQSGRSNEKSTALVL